MQVERLVLGATLTFVCALFVFIVIYRSIFLLMWVEKEAGVEVLTPELQRAVAILSLIPWFLGGIYAFFLLVIIWFVLGKFWVREKRPIY